MVVEDITIDILIENLQKTHRHTCTNTNTLTCMPLHMCEHMHAHTQYINGTKRQGESKCGIYSQDFTQLMLQKYRREKSWA